MDDRLLQEVEQFVLGWGPGTDRRTGQPLCPNWLDASGGFVDDRCHVSGRLRPAVVAQGLLDQASYEGLQSVCAQGRLYQVLYWGRTPLYWYCTSVDGFVGVGVLNDTHYSDDLLPRQVQGLIDRWCSPHREDTRGFGYYCTLSEVNAEVRRAVTQAQAPCLPAP